MAEIIDIERKYVTKRFEAKCLDENEAVAERARRQLDAHLNAIDSMRYSGHSPREIIPQFYKLREFSRIV